MSILKQKLVALLPIIVTVVVFIFSLTIIPSINPHPENLPIAVVNEDEGMDVPGQDHMNGGEKLLEGMQTALSAQAKGGEPAVKWVQVDSIEAATQGLNEKKYYAAVVIPNHFSINQATLQTADPESPKVQIYISQGANMAAANAASQLLSGMIDGLNTQMRAQLMTSLEQQGGSINLKQAAMLVSPINKEVTTLNSVGTSSGNGNAPVSLFQPIWIGSMIGAVIMLISKNNLKLFKVKQKLLSHVAHVLWGVIISVIVGYGLTWFADLWGMNIAHFNQTALILAISYFSFFMMISAVLSWTGLSGMGFFALFLFFGAPLLSLAPEFLSSFYRDYVYSWLPMRFMVDSLKDIFYFGKGLSFSGSTGVLLSIAIVGILVLLSSSIKPSRHVEKAAVITAA
ncbi:YhgE/Pip-like protein [Paenibacillus castaneae]|uniref:YhgE/Pip domain-containing protein n=1 Tax=Paenibacillus castaneae TaxID=474957 RepID=UPI001ABA636C|nr:ABC transporter permease [Paenibacillus castaneae]NIK79219.1 YhgE/Pip-like protein [Paenibacillus castaneae]